MSCGSEAAAAFIVAAALFGTGSPFGVSSDLASGAGAEYQTEPRTHVVEMKEFRFEPADLVVSVGDTIRWINRDPVPHTATAGDSTWHSDRIDAGGAWQMVVRADATPNYFCIYHPTMMGTIRIIGAGKAAHAR